MANKYCFWRSGSFYPRRTALYKSLKDYMFCPFFAETEWEEMANGLPAQSLKAVRSPFHYLRTPIPELSKTEQCVLGVLAAGKSMTALQLAAFLKMKGFRLSAAEIQKMLDMLVRESMVEKTTLYPVARSSRTTFSCIGPDLSESPPVTAYRVFGRGKQLLHKTGAPDDSRIFYYGEETRAVQTARFYADAILFNQIVLQCMLA